MKKLLLVLLVSSTLFLTSFAQLQRLALLPSSMKGGDDFASLCIDLFRDPPVNNNSYKEIGKLNSKTYDVIDYKTTRFNGEDVNQPKFLGLNNEPVPPHYKKFIDKKIQRYKPQAGERLTWDEHESLQYEVWAYNGMDELGFINRQATDQVAEYEKTKKFFIDRYGLEDDTYEICIKAKQLHLIKKQGMSIPDLKDFRFNNSEISYNVDGTKEVINVDYNGVSFQEVRNYSTHLDKGVNIYNKNYRQLPEEVSIYPGYFDNEYRLSFYGDGDYGIYRMDFKIVNNRLTHLGTYRVNQFYFCSIR